MKYSKMALNKEILFSARKAFGMFGNIQWRVVRVVGEELYIDVSSSYGLPEEKKKQIMGNISKAVQCNLSEMKPIIHIQWISWKTEHGFGCLFDVSKRIL